MKTRNLIELLDRLASSEPSDAISLRSASARIIAEWIKSGLEYPDERLDGLVYIESSIEDSIINNVHDAVKLEADTEDAYRFHIGAFVDIVKILRATVMS
jgi:hypothetical protein